MHGSDVENVIKCKWFQREASVWFQLRRSEHCARFQNGLENAVATFPHCISIIFLRGGSKRFNAFNAQRWVRWNAVSWLGMKRRLSNSAYRVSGSNFQYIVRHCAKNFVRKFIMWLKGKQNQSHIYMLSFLIWPYRLSGPVLGRLRQNSVSSGWELSERIMQPYFMLQWFQLWDAIVRNGSF